MTRPRLAYVAHSLNPGGTERLVVEMGLAFSREYEVRVFTLDEPGAWAARLLAAGVPVVSLGRRPGIDLSVGWTLAQHLRRFGADIVHAHQCSPWFYAALARFAYRPPRLLLEEHGRFWPEVDSPKRRFVNRLAIVPMTHRFVAVSRDIAERLVRYEGIPADRISIIPNGVAPAVPCDREERAVRRAVMGLREDEFVVGTVGRFDRIKNLPLLVDALAEAARAIPALRGVLIGDGPERVAIESRLRSLGLERRVIVMGHRDDARSLVACFDVFVLASLSEGMSVALLEAMSAAVPSVVTDVGGNPDLVVDGESGWIVPSKNQDALVQALIRSASDEKERVRRGIASRRRYEAGFTMSAMLDAYRVVYRSMLTGGQRSEVAGTRLA